LTGGERLALIRAKIERARKHLSDLEAEVHAFLMSRPYEISNKRDPQTREVVYYATKVNAVPSLIAASSADALQNLRSALDHLTCSLVRTSGHCPTRNTGFPIFASFGIYKAQALEKVRGMRNEAVVAIDAIKPYNGGNRVLWRLQSLINVNKQGLLNIVGLTSRFQTVTPSVLEYLRRVWGGRAGAWPAPEVALEDLIEYERWHFPLTKGDVLFVGLPDTDRDSEMNFSFDITVYEPKIADRAPLPAQFSGMAQEVVNTISSLGPYLD
jgi:hypothetical protein